MRDWILIIIIIYDNDKCSHNIHHHHRTAEYNCIDCFAILIGFNSIDRTRKHNKTEYTRCPAKAKLSMIFVYLCIAWVRYYRYKWLSSWRRRVMQKIDSKQQREREKGILRNISKPKVFALLLLAIFVYVLLTTYSIVPCDRIVIYPPAPLCIAFIKISFGAKRNWIIVFFSLFKTSNYHLFMISVFVVSVLMPSIYNTMSSSIVTLA